MHTLKRKKFFLFFWFLILIFFLSGCSNQENNSNQNISDNIINYSKLNSDTNKTENFISNPKSSEAVVSEISNFSTKIYSKDPARLHNIKLTCSRLNNIIVKNEDTFSFCKTLGPCNEQNGYQKADSYDSDGDTIKLAGGGNCQVSSTLYNAVVSIPGIQIIERNDHSKPVPYVPKGKDAAVAYGSVDFQFKNSTGHDIKLLFESNSENVIVKIQKIEF